MGLNANGGTSSLTSSNLPLIIRAEQLVILHLLLLGVIIVVLLFLLHISIAAEDGVFAVGHGRSLVRFGSVVVGGGFLATLGGRGVGVLGLVGPALAFRGRGEAFGRGVVVIGLGLGRRGVALLDAALLGRLDAGGDFGIGVRARGFGLSVGGLGLDGCFAALLGGGLGRSRFVVVIGGDGVGFGGGFGFGFLGGRGAGGGVAGGAAHELLFDDKPGGVGGFAVGEAGELGELVVIDL